MPPALQPNTIISHFRILSPLGAGGMGEVYLAEDTQLDRKVAIKVLPDDVASDAERMRRFVREAKAASALRHPNVAAIYELGESEGTRFIAMEYVEGETLDARIRRQIPEWIDSISIAIQVSDALEEAHSKGIIHRDLKPANIMLTSKGQVKVLDFGLAKIQKQEDTNEASRMNTMSQTQPGTAMGTLPYMSPEQALGKQVDHRSDIFSFGVTFYQMTTARLPFSGSTAAELIDRLLHSHPVEIARLHPGVPAEFERIIRKCLEKDPDCRFQTARELLTDLRNLKRDTEPSAVMPFQKQDSRPIARMIGIAILILIALGIGTYFHMRQAEPIRSIAVLPFDNSSKDSEIEYLSDGITESLINSLSQLPDLTVIARTSVYQYEGKAIDSKRIGQELKVQAILTGRVIQRNEGLSISAELIDTRNNSHLWGDQYNLQLSNVFAIQSEIAQTITENLRLKLSNTQKTQLAMHHTENPEAYQLFVKGRYYWNKGTEADLIKAIGYYHQAVEKDPAYALAYAGLAEAYAMAPGDINLPPMESMPRAVEAAKRALELDNHLAEAEAVLATVHFFYDWDWIRAETGFKRALELNPGYTGAHDQYAWFLILMGRYREAVTEFERAQQLDPLSSVFTAELAVPYLFQGQYDKAMELARKAIDMDPFFFMSHFSIGRIYELKGNYPDAIESFKKSFQLGNSPISLGWLGNAYALSGNKSDALNVIDQLKGLSRERRYVSPFYYALIYTGLGDKDQAFFWLEQAYRQKDSFMTFLKADPSLNPLRSDSRFAELLKRVGYSQ